MKKNIVAYVLMLFVIIFSTEVNGQSSKKKTPAKKSTSSSKKSTTKKKKTKGSTTTTEPVVETPPPSESVNQEPVVVEDEGVSTPDNVIADADTFDFGAITLDTTKPKDGYYRLGQLKGAKPFPFPKEDKNTVKFYKRIWREINTLDSENRIFSMPGETLIAFIMGGIKNGKLIAYDDDGFKKKLTYSKVMAKFRDSSIVTLVDSNGDMSGTKTVLNEFNPDSVTRFEIKEDICFDKVRGRVFTEIICIGPVKSLKTTTGSYIGDSHPFYLNFEQCRKLFAAREVIDPQRDIYNISFDDVFIQRNFKSLIVKESNPADLRIKDKYPDRINQIRESRRIEREIMRYKRNLWKFSS